MNAPSLQPFARDTDSCNNDGSLPVGGKPLAGVRILDFTRVLAGPLCTQLLGELGADIIKIESPGTGDETRAWPPFYGEGMGSVFVSVNRNKRSLSVDLKTEEGLEIMRRLATTCDVAVENFSTGVAERLGIDYASLSQLNPGIIHCSISGFGRVGPLAGASGYDVILQAFSGMMALTGAPGGAPVRIPISPIDQVTGVNALSAILAALFRRQRTGEGAQIEISLLETAISLLNHPLQSYWQTGKQPPKSGSSHESLCPYDVFEAADGPMMLGVANDGIWRRFCDVAGLQKLAVDERFETNADRVRNRDTLIALLRPVLGSKSVKTWFEQLVAVGVPVSPINDFEAMLSDKQTESIGIIVDYALEGEAPVKGVGSAFSIDGEARNVTSPPPALGAHSEDILLELGFDPNRIVELTRLGVISGSNRK